MRWTKAFEGARKTILYSMVLYLFGFILFFGGILRVLRFTLYTTLYASLNPAYASSIADDVILGGFMMFLGITIMLFGTLASFYKVFAELLAEEIKG